MRQLDELKQVAQDVITVFVKNDLSMKEALAVIEILVTSLEQLQHHIKLQQKT